MVQSGAQQCTVLHGDWRAFLTSLARREADVSERGCHARQASKAAPAAQRRTANIVLEPVVSFSVSVVAILPCMGAALPQPGFRYTRPLVRNRAQNANKPLKASGLSRCGATEIGGGGWTPQSGTSDPAAAGL